MATVGEILKATRETYGYTLEEVAALTRIHLKYLQWLENDDLGTMPEESYFLGFLAAYASFLGLPSSELCQRLLYQYRALRQGKKAPEKTEGADTSGVTPGRKPSPVRGIPAPDPAQLKIFSTEETPPAPVTAIPEPKPKAEAAHKEHPVKEEAPPPKSSRSWLYGLYILAALILLVVIYFAFPGVKKMVMEKQKTSPSATSTVPAPVPATSSPPSAADTASPASPLPLRLEARAAEDTWLGVRIDHASNRQEFILKKGERTTWWAKERFTVTVGNAGGVELFLNGNSLGRLGRHGQPIYDIQLTKEGRK